MKNGNPKNYRSIDRVNTTSYNNSLLVAKMMRFGKKNGYDATYSWIFTLTQLEADNYYFNSVLSMQEHLVYKLNNSNIR